MPSPYQVMEMVMRHFPNAELVEHLPIAQGFINTLMTCTAPTTYTVGGVEQREIPVGWGNVIKVIGKYDAQRNFTVFSYEVVEGGE